MDRSASARDWRLGGTLTNRGQQVSALLLSVGVVVMATFFAAGVSESFQHLRDPAGAAQSSCSGLESELAQDPRWTECWEHAYSRGPVEVARGAYGAALLGYVLALTSLPFAVASEGRWWIFACGAIIGVVITLALSSLDPLLAPSLPRH
jgi:hypothetical protein